MKYLVLLIGDGEMPAWDTMSEAEQGAAMGKFQAFDDACAEREGVRIVAGEALSGPTEMTTLKTRGGRTMLTEGPFAEAMEGLGGFFLIEAPDLDVLVELLGVLPAYDMQIQPAVEYE